MAAGRRWTRDELLLALHLYERIPFGQQDSKNPQIIALARRLDRTPGSVAMKLNNLTSLDPEEQARGIVGLKGASKPDRAIWQEFHEHPDVVEESERLWTLGDAEPLLPSIPIDWTGPTDELALRQVRLAQGYFRRVVLANFGGRCALTGIATPELVTASHIVPWAEATEHRVNPHNGLCLNRLHDAAFDKHLITFDDDLRMVLGRRLRAELALEPVAESLRRYDGQRLREAEKHGIDRTLLARHRGAFEALDVVLRSA